MRHCIKNTFPDKDESSLYQAEEPSDSDDMSEYTNAHMARLNKQKKKKRRKLKELNEAEKKEVRIAQNKKRQAIFQQQICLNTYGIYIYEAMKTKRRISVRNANWVFFMGYRLKRH